VGLIGWIVLGLIAGAIAKLIMPGDDPGGIIVTIIIGIVGAIVGGYIAKAIGFGSGKQFFDLKTWVVAIAGALLLLLVYRVVLGARGRAAPARR